ncbi:MAG: trigger factor [Solobacterium sp.]|nr:trigger factor [Solobacterium sp.]
MAQWTLKEHSTGELVVTVGGEEWKKACNKAFNKLVKGITIPGFRKGSAPKAMLQKYIPDDQVRYEAIEANANDWLRAALEETKLEPVARPTLDFRNMSAESVDVVFEFPVKPEVKLGEYKGLPYELGDTNVSDEDVENELTRMRETYADMEVTEEPAVDGDTVNIDYEGLKDGVPFEGGSAEGYSLRLGSGSFIPGFEDQLIGARAGEEKELNLTFPEDYHAEDLKGAAVVFKVKVNEVKHKVLPELDDDFAKDVNAPGVETVDDLRKTVRERLETQKKEAAERVADEALYEKLTENAEIDMPQAMIDEEAMYMVQQFENQIRQYGMDPAQYMKMMGQTEDDLKANYMDQAEKSLRLRLILEEIGKQEAIDVTEEDIEEEYKTLAEMYRLDVENVKKSVNEELLKDDIRNRKASEFVKEHAARA